MGLNEIISIVSLILFFAVLAYFIYILYKDKKIGGFKMDLFMNKDNTKIPEPPKMAATQQPNINMVEIMNKLTELEVLISQHHTIIYNRIGNQPTVLVDEELKYIPEEEKETYIEIKKANPKMAETLLSGYKAKTKK